MGDSLLGLTDKVVVVAGGGGGIGRATSVVFAQAGSHVVIAEIDATKAAATQLEIEQLGGQALAVQADVRSQGDVDRVQARALERFGRIDIAVNIVGGHVGYKPTIDTPAAVFQSDFTLNLISTLLCVQTFAKTMIKQGSGGAIVNMAAVSASNAAIGMPGYGVAKAGVVSLTQTLAVELAQYGIRVNAVSPSFLQGGWTSSEVGARLVKKTVPLSRAALPEDVASVILMLASPLAAYVTGQTLVVDGGHLAAIPLLADPEAQDMFRDLMTGVKGK